jgi:hypothetical protein
LKIKASAKTTTPTRAVPPLPETSFKKSDANGNKLRESRKAIVQTRIKHVATPNAIVQSKPTPAKTSSPAAPEQAKSILKAIAESTSLQLEAPSEPTVAHAIGQAARIPETMNSSLVEKIIGRPSLIAFVSTQPTAPASSNDATEIGNGESAEESEGYEDGLSAIERVRINVRPPVGEMPPDYASAKFAKSGEIVQRMGATRHWMMYEFNWEASALATRPVYFEDVNLERYGYSHGLLLEPFFSAGHFFLRVPFIPYMRGASPPRKPIYTLGYGRPGSYFPYYLHRPPVSLRGFSQQAAWTMGLIAVLP